MDFQFISENIEISWIPGLVQEFTICDRSRFSSCRFTVCITKCGHPWIRTRCKCVLSIFLGFEAQTIPEAILYPKSQRANQGLKSPGSRRLIAVPNIRTEHRKVRATTTAVLSEPLEVSIFYTWIYFPPVFPIISTRKCIYSTVN